MSIPTKDGSTMRDHYQQVAQATGHMPLEAIGPELPPVAASLWAWFREMRAGDTKVTYQEIEAWSRLNGITLERWEVRALRLLYQLLIGVANSHRDSLSAPEVDDD